MITVSHVIYNVTLLGKRKKRSVIYAIIAGTIFPDLVTTTFFLYERLILNTPSELIWKNDYPNSYWAQAASWTHSFPLVLLLLSFFWWRRHVVGKYFVLGWLAHVVVDFFVHHSDAHMQLLPFSTWKFVSPISYWEPAYYGTVVGLFEMTLSLFCLGILWGRHASWKIRTLLILVTLVVSFILGNQLLGDLFCPDVLKHFACSFG